MIPQTGDRVWFDYFGRVRTGEVVGLDGTVGIRCDDDDQVVWVDAAAVRREGGRCAR
nr:hypothetical protein [Mycobacterium eburneum]